MWSYFEVPPISAVCTIKSDNRFFSKDDLEEDEDLHKAHAPLGVEGEVFSPHEVRLATCLLNAKLFGFYLAV